MAKGKGVEKVGGKNFKQVGRMDSNTKEGKQSLKQAVNIAKKAKTKTGS